MSKPMATCLCATYGRPILLGEAVKCFLDQDYSNKELIIVNDQEGVTLIREDLPPTVRIYNCPKRFQSLGEKRNYMKSLGSGDYYFVWDDDDLYMPHRISTSIKLMEQYRSDKPDIIKAHWAVASVNNSDYTFQSNMFHSQSCITKEYIMKNQYPTKSIGEDVDFEQHGSARVIDPVVWPFYVYRWGCNTFHLSGVSDSDKAWGFAQKACANQTGEIIIKAEFQKDYWKDIADFYQSNQALVNSYNFIYP